MEERMRGQCCLYCKLMAEKKKKCKPVVWLEIQGWSSDLYAKIIPERKSKLGTFLLLHFLVFLEKSIIKSWMIINNAHLTTIEEHKTCWFLAWKVHAINVNHYVIVKYIQCLYSSALFINSISSSMTTQNAMFNCANMLAKWLKSSIIDSVSLSTITMLKCFRFCVLVCYRSST